MNSETPSGPLETYVARHESTTLVEPVGLGPLEIGRELNPITPGPFGGIDGGLQKLLTDTPSAEVRMDVHGLHLRTKASASLEMAKHHELTHPHDFTIQLSYEDIAPSSRLDLREGYEVWVRVGRVFSPLFQFAMFQERDQTLQVTRLGTPDRNGLHQSSMPVTPCRASPWNGSAGPKSPGM
jgi:hypothetical protein